MIAWRCVCLYHKDDDSMRIVSVEEHRISLVVGRASRVKGSVRRTVEPTFPNAFPGKHFSTIRSPNRVLTTLKSAPGKRIRKRWFDRPCVTGIVSSS